MSPLPGLMGRLSGKDWSEERGKGKHVGSDKEENNMEKVQRQHEESVEEMRWCHLYSSLGEQNCLLT